MTADPLATAESIEEQELFTLEASDDASEDGVEPLAKLTQGSMTRSAPESAPSFRPNSRLHRLPW